MKIIDRKDLSLGDRMKLYEKLSEKCDGMINHDPVILRLDGQAFHTWTRKMKLNRPFDASFIGCMQLTLLHLCENIPSCIMGYTQSDEISICLRNDMSDRTMPWFENRLQKLASISASMATYKFNHEAGIYFSTPIPAYFDARTIFLPNLDEVVNYFIWRQNDCEKNSVSSLAQTKFSEKELYKKNTEDKKQMLREIGIDWYKLDTSKKLGSFCNRRAEKGEYNGKEFIRNRFFIDENIPWFTLDKDYITKAYKGGKDEQRQVGQSVGRDGGQTA